MHKRAPVYLSQRRGRMQTLCIGSALSHPRQTSEGVEEHGEGHLLCLQMFRD